VRQAGFAGPPSDVAPENAAEGIPQERPFHWPIGATPADRATRELPAGWSISVGFAAAYEPLPGRPAIHPGIDLNLRSGGDSDFDAPVYAAADGVVTASGGYRVWGNIVMIAHALPEGETVWTQYAHLNQRHVAAGQIVRRGDRIGTIGKGEASRFSAHLHFEIRVQDLRPAHWPGLEPVAVRRDYRDPILVIRDGRLALASPPTVDRAQALPTPSSAAGASTTRGRWSPTPPARPGPAAVLGVGSRSSLWSPPAPTGPRPPLGKGVFVERLWEIDRGQPAGIARRARAMGLRFVVLRLAQGDQPWAVNFTPERSAAALRDLRAADLDVWGWGTLTGASPQAEAALVSAHCRELDLAGWVVEPAPSCSSTAIDGFLDSWRASGLAVRMALLTGDPAPSAAGGTLGEQAQAGGERTDPPPAGLARLAGACDAVMPRVSQVGAMGLAVAGAVGFGRPIIPVLDLRYAEIAQAGMLFLDLARSGGRPGAAVMTWDSCQLSPAGRDALRALALFGWQPGAAAEAPPDPTLARSADHHPDH
jgi:murein DD-endopeptidase MepM/ murein hydrolase activator NlpD